MQCDFYHGVPSYRGQRQQCHLGLHRANTVGLCTTGVWGSGKGQKRDVWSQLVRRGRAVPEGRPGWRGSGGPPPHRHEPVLRTAVASQPPPQSSPPPPSPPAAWMRLLPAGGWRTRRAASSQLPGTLSLMRTEAPRSLLMRNACDRFSFRLRILPADPALIALSCHAVRAMVLQLHRSHSCIGIFVNAR